MPRLTALVTAPGGTGAEAQRLFLPEPEYHPDRFADEETICVHLTPALSPSDAERENTKLTAAINRAKDSGDIKNAARKPGLRALPVERAKSRGAG